MHAAELTIVSGAGIAKSADFLVARERRGEVMTVQKRAGVQVLQANHILTVHGLSGNVARRGWKM